MSIKKKRNRGVVESGGSPARLDTRNLVAATDGPSPSLGDTETRRKSGDCASTSTNPQSASSPPAGGGVAAGRGDGSPQSKSSPLFAPIAYLRSHWISAGAIGFGLLLGLGVMAGNGWLPFIGSPPYARSEVAAFRGRGGSLSTLAAPPPPTPQLSKEFLYAGSRLLAVEDAAASAAPPADLAVWRPSTGVWYVLGGPGSAQTTYPWGSSGDIPVPGDFDGDGKTDFSVYRPSTGFWYVARSSDGGNYSVYFGVSTDIPAPADYDGDGKTDLALWRPSTYVWYIVLSSTGATIYPQFGTSGDVPTPADYDGDGKADIGVWRNSNATFYSVNSSNGQFPFFATDLLTGDRPAPADYDGDGKADHTVFRNSNATWYVRQSSNAVTVSTPHGASGNSLVQNDYDGDGKVDLAVWRSSDGQWSIKKSTNGQIRLEWWGMTGDIPVPAFYRR